MKASCLCVAVASFLAHVSPTYAWPVLTGSALENADGSYTYSYVVDNSTGADSVFGVLLTLGSIDWDRRGVAVGGEVYIPTGWEAQGGFYPNEQIFYATDHSAWVRPGETLGGFSFASWFAPGTSHYVLMEDTEGSDSGNVIGPVKTAVPEPGTQLASAIALLAIAAAWLRRR